MAFRTGFFHRSGPDPAVAVRTLIVGCIWLGRHFGTFNFIGSMAVQANFWRWGVFFRIFKMTFTAGDEPGLVITGMMMAIKKVLESYTEVQCSYHSNNKPNNDDGLLSVFSIAL